MNTILITGGAGFMGANFIYYALRNYVGIRIVVLDALTYAGNLLNLDKAIPQITFIKGNINNPRTVKDVFEKYKPDTIVHFAAETHVDRSILYPSLFIRTNVQGTYNLLSACLKYDIDRFHHISTDEVYGSLSPEDQPTPETGKYEPNSPYAATKASSDLIVRSFGHTYGLPYTISHSCNNFGPYQFPEKFIPMAMNCFIHGMPLPVHGTGKQSRDWLHVDHNSDAIALILEQGKVGEIYNISDCNEMSVIDLAYVLADMYAKITKKDVRHLITLAPERPGQDFRYALDSHKIRELGWSVTTSFETDIFNTVSWYIENDDWMTRIRNSAPYRKWLQKSYFQYISDHNIYKPIGE